MKARNRPGRRGAPVAKRPSRIEAADDTYQRIIAAARPLFAVQGYDGTSIRDITAAAGANLAAVTYHFQTKELLYLAVLRSMVGPLGASIEQAAQTPGTSLDRVEQVVRTYFGHIAANPDMPAFMVREMAKGRAPAPPIAETIRRALPAVAGAIAEGQARGEIRPGDPVLMALSTIAQPVFLFLARGALATVVGLNPNEPAVLTRLVDHAVVTMRRALEAR
jgi:AcrR family transcriptional regulator